eukprot:m.900518 g.900518  ORF g.900518 m.900518 type:complete len:571 (+) comp23685_c0_seq26:128-1840(+)
MAAPPSPISSFYGPVHVAVTWQGGVAMQGVDLDIAACAYTAEGNQIDVCYFKKPTACGSPPTNAIGNMGDNQSGHGYAMEKEGIFVNLAALPQECNFVFIVVSVRSGANTLADCGGAGLKIVDGTTAGGRFIATAPLNIPAESCLACVLIRGPPHMYPPSWMLHITSGVPQAHGPGRDFNEAIALIEEYLRSSVPPNLLANRPPNNPMEQFDMNKTPSYFLDPSCRKVEVGLGWESSCNLDVHCHLMDEWYQKRDYVYYGNVNAPGVMHSGDSKDGGESRAGNPDEVVYLHLDSIDADVKHIVFCVHIREGELLTKVVQTENGPQTVQYRGPAPHSFSGVRNTFARLLDTDRKFILADYRLSEDGRPGQTRMMLVLSRFGADGQRWQMISMGTPIPNAPSTVEIVRKALIEETRPDLLRRVSINMGCIAGKGLKACDNGKTSDPYCSIKFYDHTQHKSQAIKKTLNPEWNEPNLYTWTGRIADLLERIYAKIDIYDKDMLRDDFMGRIYLHVREVLGTRGRGVQQRWFPLGEKHTNKGEQKKGMFDGLRGFTGNFPGEVLLQWEVTAARA